MMKNKNPTTGRQITNLLALLFTAVLCACVMAGTMIYYYGPTGQYLAKRLLVAPEMVNGLAYAAWNQAEGKRQRYVYHQTEFMYKVPGQVDWERVQVSGNSYQNIFTFLSADESLVEEELDGVPLLFRGAYPGSLILSVKPDQQSTQVNQSSLAFQEVHFLPDGHYYRIEARDEEGESSWVYFEHENVYSEVLRLLHIES